MARFSDKGRRGRRRGSDNRGKDEGRRKRGDGKGRASLAREGRAQESAQARGGSSSNADKRALRRLLEGIGSPAPSPFKPDPFQLEALAALEYEDVLVTAPTGSGKTWIAREEIR